jgi:hypothetical protein
MVLDGSMFVLMLIVHGFEWHTVQHIDGTIFKQFLFSISSFLDIIFLPSICVFRNITIGNSWHMLQSG